MEEDPKEYCPNCGHDRSRDEEKHKCAKCGCHTPSQDFPPDFLTNDPGANEDFKPIKD